MFDCTLTLPCILVSVSMTVKELDDHIFDVFEQCARMFTLSSSDATAGNMLSLKSLTSALPKDLCAVLDKLRADYGVDDKPQLLAALIFRSYELHQISIILQELNRSLKLTHSQTTDFVSRLIQIITIS